MKDTNILADTDFCENSLYRSYEAEAKLADWCQWAEANLPEKDLKDIARAFKKLNRGKI